jgi:LmbE family N-acetylglucosaminyl deacetylase
LLKLDLFALNKEPKLLCLGAHPDDIEIGCGATLLKIIEQLPKAEFYWAVFSGNEQRRKEATDSAHDFLGKAAVKKIVVKDFQDSYFPFFGEKIKDYFEKELRHDFAPDLIFTHYSADAHQDHRLISSLTWNTYRNNIILEYELPKFDGDLATPNMYINIDGPLVERKIILLLKHFKSQTEKRWFDPETFRAILRIRGVESNSPSRYSEAFYCRKIVV